MTAEYPIERCTKIKCNNEAEAKAFLQLCVAQDIRWIDGDPATTQVYGDTYPVYFYIDGNGALSWGHTESYFQNDSYREIFLHTLFCNELNSDSIKSITSEVWI